MGCLCDILFEVSIDLAPPPEGYFIGSALKGARFNQPNSKLNFFLNFMNETPDLLFTLEDLERAYLWIFKIRKNYSHHSDIWLLRRNWDKIKFAMFRQLNEGSYQRKGLFARRDQGAKLMVNNQLLKFISSDAFKYGCGLILHDEKITT